MSIGAERELRYQQWELERRRMVEELGKGDIGYVHLKAMGAGDIADFTRNFYPVFNRKGLVAEDKHTLKAGFAALAAGLRDLSGPR